MTSNTRWCVPAGSRVAHLGCGPAALSKLLASQGMQVVGVDTDVSAARKRGLSAEPFNGIPFSTGCLQGLASHDSFDTVLIYGGWVRHFAVRCW